MIKDLYFIYDLGMVASLGTNKNFLQKKTKLLEVEATENLRYINTDSK